MHASLVCGASILEPERHCRVAEDAVGHDECCLLFVLFFHSDLLIARVSIKEQETTASGIRVDDLIDSREQKIVLRAMLVQDRVVDAHPLDVCILLQDKHRVC